MLATSLAPRATPRLAYLDNLRVFLTVLVIMHHAGQPYGHGGWWYYEEVARWPWLGTFFYINDTFFMCLFFLISAYFMPGSYDRKGPGAFLRDRFLRLGVPLLLFTLLIQPVQTYAYYLYFRGGSLPYLRYFTQVYLGFGPEPANWSGPTWPDLQLGHLWFLEHLLLYALIYAAWRFAFRRTAPERAVAAPRPAPSSWAIAGFTLALGLTCFVVRIWYPVQWEAVLGFIQAQRGRLPQYIAWVVIGTLAYRRNWLTTLPQRTGQVWLGVSAIAIAIYMAVRVSGITFGPLVGPVIHAVWENLMGVGLVVGLPILFRARWQQQSHLARTLSESAYGAYIFHMPIVIAAQYGVAGLALHPLIKFGLVCIVSVPGSFLISQLVRRLPGARSIL